MRISISLDRNNLGKKAKVGEIDRLLDSISDNPKVLKSFKPLCNLPEAHSAWIDKIWQMIVILDKAKNPVGGVNYDSHGNYVSTDSIKLLPVAQGKGLMRVLLETIIKLHGGIFSSHSISPGAALIFKKLCDKYTGYIAWPADGIQYYADISSWKPRGIYKVFPCVLAPDGKEYPVDELEESIGRIKDKKIRMTNQQWKYGEIFVSENGTPPTGFKRLL